MGSERHASLREDSAYKKLDADCRRLVREQERALSAWLAQTEVATPEERRLKMAYEKVSRAYARATEKRTRRREELRRKWFGND